MARHHHVNLGVAPGGLDEQRSFLVDILGYQSLALTDTVREIAPQAQWFEAADGSQIHLSEDANHRPAERAHVAVEFDDDELDVIRTRLESSSVDYQAGDPRPGFPRSLILCDPAGNRWELRGPTPA